LVLQRTFTSAIADGAIERMIGEQEFKYSALCLFNDGTAGAHHHTIGNGRRARGDRSLCYALYFDQACATRSDRTELRVIAKDGDIDAMILACFPEQCALRDIHAAPINRDMYLVFQSVLRSSDRCNTSEGQDAACPAEAVRWS